MSLVQGCTKSNMADWKQRKMGKKCSQTPGSQKVDRCQADARKKFMAKRSRSYKHSGYSDWCRECDAMNGAKVK